jgi:hypothetical protein
MNRGKRFPLFSVQSLHDVELKLSLRRRLVRFPNAKMHAFYFAEKPISRLAFGSADTKLSSPTR